MPDKKAIIAQVYNEFYGSIRETYNDAHKKDASIKYQDVKNWFDNSFTRKTQFKGL